MNKEKKQLTQLLITYQADTANSMDTFENYKNCKG